MSPNKKSKSKEKVYSQSFFLVVIGQIISLFGNAIIRFALPLHILKLTGSAAIYGTLTAVAFIPLILMMPIGGVIADRFNKRNIMVVLDFSVAAIISVTTLLSGLMSPVILFGIVLMLFYGIYGTYQPAVQASIPLLVKEKGIVNANAIINMIASLSGLVGPVIGGLCYSRAGLLPILIIGIICFTFSAIMEIFIKMKHTPMESKGSLLHIVTSDLKESINYVRTEQKIIIKISFMVAICNILLSSFMMVGFPVIITQVLSFSDSFSTELLGYLEASLGLGGLAGGVLCGVLAKKVTPDKIYILLEICGILLLPIGAALFFNLPDMACFVIMMVIGFITMAISTIFSVISISYVQQMVPEHLVGKVLSLCMTIGMCASPIGQSVYGIILENFKEVIWIIPVIAGLGTAIAAYLFKNPVRKEFKSMEASRLLSKPDTI